MANRSDHDVVGLLTGVVSTVLGATLQGRTVDLCELVGGAAGGALLSRAPDVLEPALHPNHRQFAHSMVTAGTLGAVAVPAAFRAQHNLARQAAQMQSADPVRAAVYHLLAGFVAGAVPGYLSHVALDACTPKGIPLMGRL
jgi:inner membrane protein